MNIRFDEQHQVFKLDTPNTSYVMALADGRWLGHLYYGPRLEGTDLLWAMDLDKFPFTPEVLPRESGGFQDGFPSEYPPSGCGDFREPCLTVMNGQNQPGCLPEYVSCRILAGKPALEGLPATFGGEDDCNTLVLTLQDAVTGLEIELLYTAFTELDVITRSVHFVNHGTEPLRLERALSACIHLPYEGQQSLNLRGSWGRERWLDFQPIGCAVQTVASRRGVSSHQEQPFLALTSPDVTQERGEVWAMHLVYSGSFLAAVQRDQYDTLRMEIGIHPDTFSWRLAPGEAFQTPEAVLVYSDGGLGHMTHTFHDLYRNHLLPQKQVYAPRPVLLNNWEATYFDFDEDKLLAIARRAAELGVELFVLDDGWFGQRDTDNCSLGDWQVNLRKLPHGLKGLAERVNALGLRFGLWMEPEMVSPDSDLYRAHPDWALQLPGRAPRLCRNQLVLDLSRPEVEEYIWRQISDTLHSANISYLKWDMNRSLSDLGSAALPPERQGELSHRYVLALYRLQKRLTEEFPDLLLENCSSGGGRFDPGMLACSPQIWCSDDTDAIERLAIQEGTALLYPLSCIGAHVSICPNHQTGRTTPLQTRSVVAMMGTFGYELDLAKLTEEEQRQIPAQIERYHAVQSLVQRGDYYRLASVGSGDQLDAQMVVSKDQSEALVTLVWVLHKPNWRTRHIRLAGLEPGAVYQDGETGRRYGGDALMHIGLPVELPEQDFASKQVLLKRV